MQIPGMLALGALVSQIDAGVKPAVDAGIAATVTASVTFNPGVPGDIGTTAVKIAEAYQGHQWSLLAAGVLTILVLVIRPLLTKIPKTYVPWVAMLVSLASSVAVGLQTKQGMVAILTTGVLVGVAAVGGWEVFGKAIRGLIRKILSKKASTPLGA